jgi:hypothetical protein
MRRDDDEDAEGPFDDGGINVPWIVAQSLGLILGSILVLALVSAALGCSPKAIICPPGEVKIIKVPVAVPCPVPISPKAPELQLPTLSSTASTAEIFSAAEHDLFVLRVTVVQYENILRALHEQKQPEVPTPPSE